MKTLKITQPISVIGWWITLSLLISGISSPLFTFRKLYFLKDTFSLLGGLGQLWTTGEYLLFVVIFSFSIIMPGIKMGFLFNLCHRKTVSQASSHKQLKFVHFIGRWSMLDVFVIAVMVSTIKLGIIATVDIHFGLYLFCAAVICSMILTSAVEKLHTWEGGPE